MTSNYSLVEKHILVDYSCWKHGNENITNVHIHTHKKKQGVYSVYIWKQKEGMFVYARWSSCLLRALHYCQDQCSGEHDTGKMQTREGEIERMRRKLVGGGSEVTMDWKRNAVDDQFCLSMLQALCLERRFPHVKELKK